MRMYIHYIYTCICTWRDDPRSKLDSSDAIREEDEKEKKPAAKSGGKKKSEKDTYKDYYYDLFDPLLVEEFKGIISP